MRRLVQHPSRCLFSCATQAAKRSMSAITRRIESRTSSEDSSMWLSVSNICLNSSISSSVSFIVRIRRYVGPTCLHMRVYASQLPSDGLIFVVDVLQHPFQKISYTRHKHLFAQCLEFFF